MIRFTPVIEWALLCLSVTVTQAQSLPFVDSAMLTARSYPQTAVARLQGAATRVQGRLQAADAIKMYAHQRKAVLSEPQSHYPSLPGLTAALAGFKQQAWYYADHVQTFRPPPNQSCFESAMGFNKHP